MVGRQDWYLENHPFLKPEPAENPPLQRLVVPCWFIHPLRRDESRVSGQTEVHEATLFDEGLQGQTVPVQSVATDSAAYSLISLVTNPL